MQTAAHESKYAATLDEPLRAPRRTTVADVPICNCGGGIASGLGGHYCLNRVVLNVRSDDNLLAPSLESGNLLAIHDLREIDLVLLRRYLHDPAQVVTGRIIDQDFHKKPVELRFGKRVRAFHFDRVLSRHHKEGSFQRVGRRAAGYRALLHGLEE